MGALSAIFSAGACVALGMAAAERLKTREALIRRWEGALSRMDLAVRLGNAPLTEVLRRGAGEDVPELGELRSRLLSSPAQAPEAFLNGLSWHGLWTGAEKQALTECLAALFSPVPEEQTRALARVREELAAARLAARAKREKNARLCVALGWLSGAAAFILLC